MEKEEDKWERELMVIDRKWGYKYSHSYIYDQVRDTIQAALANLKISFEFDINEGAEVLEDESKRGGIALFDNCSNPIEGLKRNKTPKDTLIIAPMSIARRHWSLMIYYNGRVYLYHTTNQLSARNKFVRYSALNLFGKFPIVRIANKYQQEDDMACGAFVIMATIQIAQAISKGEKPSLSFGLTEVCWILSSKTEATIGGPDSNPPEVEVPFRRLIGRKIYKCPLCEEEEKKGEFFTGRKAISGHLSLVHGSYNAKSMAVAREVKNKMAFLEENGHQNLEDRLCFLMKRIL